MKRKAKCLLTGAAAMSLAMSVFAAGPESELKIVGDWSVEAKAVSPAGKALDASFAIDPVEPVKVMDERCDKLPDYNPKAWGGWQRGYALKAVKAQECSVKSALDPLSLKVSDAPGEHAEAYFKGKDYEAELDWGSIGRLPNGSIEKGGTVFISYEYRPQRIDSIVVAADGNSLILKKGKTHVSLPQAPELAPGEKAVGNIYLSPGRHAKLSDDALFPITETAFPSELAASAKGSAEKLLPKTMKKLREGGKLKILAWGDSVTDGGFLPEKDKNRWQAQFLARLKAQYPKADIELSTEAWGGHNTTNYLAEPPGALHNYQEKVLDAKPDLIVLEFVNDAGMRTAQVEERYGKLLKDFNAIGAELILNTPHYVRPDWMGLNSQKGIDNDPREYVKALREFAAKNNVALSDVSARYGRLWRQGIPYGTLMQNAINHPNPYGMGIYADALMNIFPK